LLQSAHRSETSGVLLSCSAKNELRLFSFAGKQLASVDAAGLHNHMAAISLDGRFFAAATFTSDVKVCTDSSFTIEICPACCLLLLLLLLLRLKSSFLSE